MEKNLFTGNTWDGKKKKLTKLSGEKNETKWAPRGVKIDGKPVLGKTYEGKYEYSDAKKFIQSISNLIYETEGEGKHISVSLHFRKSREWRGMTFTPVGDIMKIFDPSDSPTHHGFVVDGIQLYVY